MSDPVEQAIAAEHARQEQQLEFHRGLHDQIKEILGRYRVEGSLCAGEDGGGTKFAVVSGARIDRTLVQHTRLMGESDANLRQADFTARDILELVSKPENVAGLMGGPSR